MTRLERVGVLVVPPFACSGDFSDSDLLFNVKKPHFSWLQVETRTLSEGGKRTDPEQMPMVVVTLGLKRNPSYFVINVVVPSFSLSYLLILVFLLPTASGEKIALQVTFHGSPHKLNFSSENCAVKYLVCAAGGLWTDLFAVCVCRSQWFCPT